MADPGAVLVAGDTVADLEAGHAAHVGQIVAVLSGAGSRERLAAKCPTAILDSPPDLPEWWDARWPPERQG